MSLLMDFINIITSLVTASQHSSELSPHNNLDLSSALASQAGRYRTKHQPQHLRWNLWALVKAAIS